MESEGKHASMDEYSSYILEIWDKRGEMHTTKRGLNNFKIFNI